MWVFKKQTFVLTSSLISEFCAFTLALKQALWIKELLVGLGLKEKGDPIPFYSDSQNALDIFIKNGYLSATRWINNQYFFVKNEVNKGIITLYYINRQINPANIMTKLLERVKFKSL